MEIRLAQTSDIDCWMALVNQVKDVFPGLETEAALAEHRTDVLRFIDMNCAICAKEDGRLAGALLFSKETSVLCFLAVSPHYRRQHIGRRMFDFMLTQMDPDRDITVTTYRKTDPNGTAARAFYRQLGFSEGALTEEFGAPVQQFILKRSSISE